MTNISHNSSRKDPDLTGPDTKKQPRHSKSQSPNHHQTQNKPPRNKDPKVLTLKKRAFSNRETSKSQDKNSFQILKNYFRSLSSFWLVYWILTYFLIIILSLCFASSILTTLVKLSGILFCLVYVVLDSRQDYFLVLAMTTTLIADFILAIDNTAVLGVIFFLITQIVHLTRLTYPRHSSSITAGTAAIACLVALNHIFNFVPPIVLICCFYIAILITNLVISKKQYQQSPNNSFNFCAFLGFSLFLCCDLCVGASFLSLQGYLPPLFYAPANFFAWLFYYPAQIFLSNSTKCAKMIHKGR